MPQVLDGRYELGDRIGRGGAARVHRAIDQRLGREVAVKVLDDQAAAQADPAGRDRFLLEAKTAAQLRHPHVVTVFDAGESDGELFLVMELIEGITLSELIATRAPLPTEEAAKISIQILGALQAAHDLNIVHRDVKPANVIIDADGDAHLTDFGIARRLDGIEDHLTSAGMVIGTPTYLAPEQAAGGTLGVTTDVYLAGLVLDEMLTARRSRSESRSHEVGARLAVGAVVFDPRDVVAGTDDALARVVVKATDPNPGRRFASAAEMAVALATSQPIEVVMPGRSPIPLWIDDVGAEPFADASPRTATLVMPEPATSVLAESSVAGAGSVVGRTAPSPSRTARRRSMWGLLPFVVAAIALMVVVVLADASGGDDLPTEPAATVPASQAPQTTTANPDDAVGGGGGSSNDDPSNGKGKGRGRVKD